VSPVVYRVELVLITSFDPSNATLKVTKLVIPGMVQRKRGLILTVGSFASLIPSPLLAVYSGSKAFLSTWSQALGSELEGTGVTVELLNTYFVVSIVRLLSSASSHPSMMQVSKLSKIRNSSWMIPKPSTYVRESNLPLPPPLRL
jgi:17beta-estradiol 17-dehydrogenase / very-long-chain 3-oxoacyl-CoA reductase